MNGHAAVAARFDHWRKSLADPSERTDRDAMAARCVERSRLNPEEFSLVFDAYFAEIHGYAARRLGADAADDIAASTFETAFTKRDGFDQNQGTVRAWLYGITTRHISRRRRDEARRYRAMERLPHPVPAEGPEDRVVSAVTATTDLRRLAGVLAAMPQADRDVLLLVALAELSLTEVSVALSIPYGTVGSRLSRARREIRQHTGSGEPAATPRQRIAGDSGSAAAVPHAEQTPTED